MTAAPTLARIESAAYAAGLRPGEVDALTVRDLLAFTAAHGRAERDRTLAGFQQAASLAHLLLIPHTAKNAKTPAPWDLIPGAFPDRPETRREGPGTYTYEDMMARLAEREARWIAALVRSDNPHAEA